MIYIENKKYSNIFKKLVIILILFMLFFCFESVDAETKDAYLIDGLTINSVMPISRSEFRKATIDEYNDAIANGYTMNIISTSESLYPVYLWDDTGLDAALYYSEANHIYLNPDSRRMFRGIGTIYTDNPTSTNFLSIDVSEFDTSLVTNMLGMFANNTKLLSLDLSNWNTSNVTNMGDMFANCRSISELNLSNFDTSKVYAMAAMFYGMQNLTNLDISNFDTSNIMSMAYMFCDDTKLQELDVSHFNTSNVTNMDTAFYGLRSLTELDVSHFDTSNVTNMNLMFAGMYLLESIDVSNFDTSKVTSMEGMFNYCKSLTELDLSHFDTSNVTNMSGMLSGLKKITSLNVSSFDTSKVTRMDRMFGYDSELVELDISSFNTSNVETMENMFIYLDSIETIYVSELFSTSKVSVLKTVISDAPNLVGQAGTHFSTEHTNKSYLRIDDPDNGNPGYLTYKEYRPKIIFPNGTFEQVDLYSVYTFQESYSKNSDVAAVVTLNPNYEGADNKYAYVEKQYIFSNWVIKGEVYNPGDTLVVTHDIHLDVDYTEVTVGAELTPVYRENHRFKGWYTDPDNGDLIENYSTEEDITLYAHWSEAQTTTVTTPTEVYYVPTGDNFIVPVNDISKQSENIATVTFIYNDEITNDLEKNVVKSFTPSGWTIDGNNYADESVITVNDGIILEPNYVETINEAEYPANPVRDGYIFDGWYDAPTNGNKIDSYSSEGDITLYAYWTAKTTYTVDFESHGGPSVASYDISTDTLGTLPSPTMDGYLFDGWYKESDYQNKVSSNTVVTGDMTLHAKWVSNPFAYVYPRHTESLVCDGATYVDTGVMLYNYDPVTGTGNWDKDYEIGFTIEEYDYNSQTTEQAVFMNTKYENQAAGWPGLVVRKAVQKIEITQTTDSGKVQRYISNLTFPMDVKIIRKNKTVYYQVNGGTLYTVQNMSNFTKFFDIPVYFCAGDDGNGGVQRYLVGTISNYYVKMGTYEDVVNYSVVYPNATVEIIEKNTVLDLGPNEEPKASENISKVTFNYNDGVTADTENYVKRVYTPNGYMIDGVHYDDGAKLVVDNNKTITYSYTDSIAGVEFPENPTRSHYIFTGWYDDPDNGNLVENYDGLNDITLYAHWEMNLPTSVEVDEDDLHMVTGDVHQVELTFSPDDSYDNAIYSGYDSSIISVVDGTITAISKGTTTITVSFEHVPLTETISVTVLSNKIESNTYEVRAATSGRDRIVIGSELLTTIGEFKNNLLNPNQYIQAYDSNNNLINDSEIVMTGQVIKLVYGQTDMDEAIMVVRGDINGDGYVNVMDQIILTNSTAGVAPINPSTEYPKFAAADVEEDEFINRLDEVKMMNFVIDSIDSLNN